MDVTRPSPSGRALWILLLAGLWPSMVQLGSCRNVSLPRASNPAAASCTPSSCNQGSCPFRKCNCYSGYTGSDCNEVPLRCSNDLSCNYGTCQAGRCVCNDGYTGSTCNQEVQSCSWQTCRRGDCPTRDCVCVEDYGGPLCNQVLGVGAGYFNIAAMVIFPIGIPLAIYVCCSCCFCQERWAWLTHCKCCKKDTITTTVRAEENVYVDIAVISNGRYEGNNSLQDQ
ncbi:uncharacterized protein LOC144807917 isoform X1 [Lissotriton helveticus]